MKNRMQGKPYNKRSLNSTDEVEGKERKMGGPCISKRCKKSVTLKCSTFSNKERIDIFNNF